MPLRLIAVCGSLGAFQPVGAVMGPGLFAGLAVAEMAAVYLMRRGGDQLDTQSAPIMLTQAELTTLSQQLNMSEDRALTIFLKCVDLRERSLPMDDHYHMIWSKVCEALDDAQVGALNDLCAEKMHDRPGILGLG